MPSSTRTTATLLTAGLALPALAAVPAHAATPTPTPPASSAVSSPATPDASVSNVDASPSASQTPSASSDSSASAPSPGPASSQRDTAASAPPVATVMRASSVHVPNPTSWGLSVLQSNTRTPGVAWLHFGGLTVTGRLSPAPAAGTIIDILRDGRVGSHTRTRADGSWTASLPDSTTAGTFSVQARIPATGATSPGVTMVNKMPSITTTAPALLDSVRAGSVALSVQPAMARPVALTVKVVSRWRLHRNATTNAAGRASTAFTYGSGFIGKLSVRGQYTAPDGTLISSTGVVNRVPRLDAVVRNTTLADVRYSYRAGCPVGPSRLSTITMNYIGYDHRVHTNGQLVVARHDAARVVRAFAAGMAGGTPIKTMLNPNHFVTHGRADDYRMMNAGNTSAFNCRLVSGNPNATSPHTYGYAIDVNDWENPYYNNVSKRWYGDVRYATRRPTGVTGLLVSSSPLVKALKAQGAEWYYGFDWQHFDMPH